MVCGYIKPDFVYREIVHIHHMEPLKDIPEEGITTTIEDAIKKTMPLCPTCHSVVHANEGARAFIIAKVNSKDKLNIIMKIFNLCIKNFRCLHDIDLPFESLTALVGRNGTGKSSVLKAIENFYNINYPVSTARAQLLEQYTSTKG